MWESEGSHPVLGRKVCRGAGILGDTLGSVHREVRAEAGPQIHLPARGLQTTSQQKPVEERRWLCLGWHFTSGRRWRGCHASR